MKLSNAVGKSQVSKKTRFPITGTFLASFRVRVTKGLCGQASGDATSIQRLHAADQIYDKAFGHKNKGTL